MQKFNFTASFIWNAYNENGVVGSKVKWASDMSMPQAQDPINKFEQALASAIVNKSYEERVPGQMKVKLPESALEYISCGLGRASKDPADYLVRKYRGNVQLFLRRELALPAAEVYVNIYTRSAYLADPQLPEPVRVLTETMHKNTTHFLVGLLAQPAGVSSEARGCYRFVDCLAGGNNEAAMWDRAEIIRLAKINKEYQEKFCVVADPFIH